jgi:hypothetical protein
MRHIRDNMPNREFDLLEIRQATRTDLTFAQRAAAGFL